MEDTNRGGSEVRRGARVILLSEGGMKIPAAVEEGVRRVEGVGVVDTGRLIGVPYGSVIKFGERRFIVLKPSLLDHIETLKRRAQIILPKDSALIIMNCDISAGSVVVEGGSGSGALTLALAHAVAPDGRVISYDTRADFLSLARRNVEAAGYGGVCTFKEGDVCTPGGIEERGVDAVVLDIPEPWRALENAWQALAPCGHLASYSPTVNQVEQTVRALNEMRFIEVFTIETLQREMAVVERGIRPAFDMLGHSGYLTFARKVLEKF
ncbi:MAG: tRNA (adenine-N1)-methyltransferase [Thermoplasmata archaeon]